MDNRAKASRPGKANRLSSLNMTDEGTEEDVKRKRESS